MKTFTTLTAPFNQYVVDVESKEIYTLSNSKAKGQSYKLSPVKENIYRMTVEGIRKTFDLNALISDFLGVTFIDESNLVKLVKPYQNYKIDKTTKTLYHANTMERVTEVDGIFEVVGEFGNKKRTAFTDYEYMSFFTTSLI